MILYIINVIKIVVFNLIIKFNLISLTNNLT